MFSLIELSKSNPACIITEIVSMIKSTITSSSSLIYLFYLQFNYSHSLNPKYSLSTILSKIK